MNKLLSFIKKLRCEHIYQYSHQYKINGGMTKIVVHKCIKCDKLKYYEV